jgi:RNA polymerase-binding transcription factor DksA
VESIAGVLGALIFVADQEDCNVRSDELASIREGLRDSRRTLLEMARSSQEGEAQRRLLSMIDGALARVHAGAYGLCADCGTEIGRKRLAALPFALLCAECVTRRERGETAEVEGSSP